MYPQNPPVFFGASTASVGADAVDAAAVVAAASWGAGASVGVPGQQDRQRVRERHTH